MQTTYIKKLRKGALMMLAAFSLIAATSCSKSDEPTKTPEPETFQGILSTSIPAMPNFTAVTSEVTAKITWQNAEQSLATLNLDAFTIETGMPGRDYNIGAMEIKDIKCTKAQNGTISLKLDSFNCMAGEFNTTGSVEGEYKNGKLTFTAIYKPGSMPFDVKSVFTTK